MTRLVWSEIGPSAALGFTSNPSGDDIISRGSGDFVAAGARRGGLVRVTNANTAGNDGLFRITAAETFNLSVRALDGSSAGLTNDATDNSAVLAFEKAVTHREADVDQFTFRRALQKAAKLLGLVEDLAHGTNSPPITINHSGGGQGALLGVPLAMPCWPKVACTVNVAGEVSLFKQIVHLPAGEDTIDVEYEGTGGRLQRVIVLDATDLTPAVEDEVPLEQTSRGTMRATVAGLTGGADYVVDVRMRAEGIVEHSGLLIYFRRQGDPGLGDPTQGASDDPIAVPTQSGASSATIADINDIHDYLVADDLPVMSYVLELLRANAAALDEELLGRPAFGANASYSLASSTGDNNPADDAFKGPSRSLYAAEPMFDFPILAQSFGACPPDGLLSGAYATTNGKVSTTGYPPGFIDNSGSSKYIARWPVKVPDFKLQAESSPGQELYCKVLVFSPDQSIFGTATSQPDARLVVYNAAGTAITTYTVAYTSWTRPDASQGWAIIEFGPLNFDPDDWNEFRLGFRASVMKDTSNGESLRLASAFIGFEAT